jgi:hypothetical protein
VNRREGEVTKITTMLSALLILFLGDLGYGQSRESMEPRAGATVESRKLLQYQYRDMNWDSEMALLDEYLVQIQSPQDSIGLIVVHNGRNHPRGSGTRRALAWRNYIVVRAAEMPVLVLEGENMAELTLGLWVVPRIGQLPDVGLPDRGKPITTATLYDKFWFARPLKLPGGETEDLHGEKTYETEIASLAGFAQVLLKNPSLEARIVIHATRRDRRSDANQILELHRFVLSKQLLISNERIKLSHGSTDTVRWIELWLVPTHPKGTSAKP